MPVGGRAPRSRLDAQLGSSRRAQDEAELERIVEHIEQNPLSAGLAANLACISHTPLSDVGQALPPVNPSEARAPPVEAGWQAKARNLQYYPTCAETTSKCAVSPPASFASRRKYGNGISAELVSAVNSLILASSSKAPAPQLPVSDKVPLPSVGTSAGAAGGSACATMAGLAGESACPTMRQAADSAFSTNPGGVKESSPWRKPWVKTRIVRAPEGRKNRPGQANRFPCGAILRPSGAGRIPPDSHGLRRTGPN